LVSFVHDAVELVVDAECQVSESVLDLSLDFGFDEGTEDGDDGVVEYVVTSVGHGELHRVQGDAGSFDGEGMLAAAHSQYDVDRGSFADEFDGGVSVVFGAGESLSAEPKFDVLQRGSDAVSREADEGLEVLCLKVLDVKVSFGYHADVDLVG